MAINKEQLYDAIEQTKGYVDKHIEELLDAIYKKGGYVIVDSLPVNGDQNKTYLVPKVDSNGYAISGSYLEYIYAVRYTTGTTITDGLIDFTPDKFKNKISASGTYAFIFNGVTWEYDNNIIVLADYGINILNGIAVKNDTITVVVSNGAWEPMGDTSLDLSGFYNKTEIDNKETAINNTITTKETALNTAISGKENQFRYATMPTANNSNFKKIIQYIGETTNDYIKGYSYICLCTTKVINKSVVVPLGNTANYWNYAITINIEVDQTVTTTTGITNYKKNGVSYDNSAAYAALRIPVVAGDVLVFASYSGTSYARTVYYKAIEPEYYYWDQYNVQPQPQSISSIDDIEDVNITDPQNNQILVYDETSDEWQNKDLEIPSGDFDDLSNRPTNANLSDVFESGMPSGVDITLRIPNGFTPVGTIISVMGNSAPANYIVCDGSIFNITQYPDLANYFEAQFGTKNHFGGNGTTTFAVPDLRGEFLRGTGTNSHTDQGSGANVGVHQDGTIIPFSYSNSTAVAGSAYSNLSNEDAKKSNIGRAYTSTGTTQDNAGEAITPRPTNTSVLYCIAYKNIYLADTDANYSLYDIGYYNDQDEKFYAEDTYDTEKVGNTRLLYISLDTNVLYRFDGEDFIPLTSESNGPSLPSGGTTGQVLAKHSNDDGDAEWIDAPETGGHSIKNNGTAVADESSLNFTDFDISDDSTNEETDIKSHRLTSSEMADICSPLPGAPSRLPILYDESETERQTGWYKYANSTKKPVYEKECAVSVNLGAQSWVSAGNILVGADKLLCVTGVQTGGTGGNISLIGSLDSTTGEVQIMNMRNVNYGTVSLLLTLQYTKTADIPS